MSINIYFIVFSLAFSLVLNGCSEVSDSESTEIISETICTTEYIIAQDESPENTEAVSSDSDLTSPDDISLFSSDGEHYEFTYNNCTFHAEYTEDNWKIINSYMITNKSDMIIICQALADAHPTHNSDYSGYRTPEDMAYEWEQHNIAYDLLPDGTEWKESARDADIDPKDQGKSVYDFINDRL